MILSQVPGKSDPLQWNKAKAEKFIQMAGQLLEFLGDNHKFHPKTGVYDAPLLFTPKTKDIEVSEKKTNGNILVTAPSDL